MNNDINYIRAICALAFVTGLIWLLGFAIEKSGLDKRFTPGNSSKKRIILSDTLYLDPKNRLLLVEYNNQEHLVLVGGTSNLLIASNNKEAGNAQ